MTTLTLFHFRWYPHHSPLTFFPLYSTSTSLPTSLCPVSVPSDRSVILFTAAAAVVAVLNERRYSDVFPDQRARPGLPSNPRVLYASRPSLDELDPPYPLTAESGLHPGDSSVAARRAERAWRSESGRYTLYLDGRTGDGRADALSRYLSNEFVTGITTSTF